MIFPESKVKVCDNSGAKIAKCIKVAGFSRKSGAKPASVVTVSVRKIRANKDVVKGQVVKGILVRGRKNLQRNTGLNIKFDAAGIILINAKSVPIGTRFFGPMFKELRNENYPKVLLLAKTII